MSQYERTNWQDHTVEYPGRYRMTDNGDGTVTLTPVPGEVYTQGTPITAGRMNNIEDRIDELAGIKLEMLWTNTSISSNFAAQTVNLSRAVKEGEICIIAYDLWGTNSDYPRRQIALCQAERATILDNRGNKGNGTRTARLTGSTCVFSACTYAGSVNNADCKPYYIAALNPQWLIAAVSPN
jgi:hypothetical protein